MISQTKVQALLTLIKSGRIKIENIVIQEYKIEVERLIESAKENVD